YVFFEVKILDPKSKTQLCFLDKVEPNATIAEIKTLLHKKYPKFYPSRQELKLHPGKLSHPSIIIVNLFYFIFYIYVLFNYFGHICFASLIHAHLDSSSYSVFLAECLGPLFIYLLFYYRLPYIYMHEYDFTRKYLTPWQAYYIIHPLFTPPSKCSLWFRPAEIPYPTNNPFTWLFFFVSCPYEVLGVFAFWGFIQMTIWARAKHKTYIEQFKDSPDLRTAIILLFF
uniref:Trans-2,3-enoyl-CoA reductase-like 2b n=1 Tax=Sinocyclocheilus grahami TaxID=75366 RepID=A0A672PB02_SINGR